MRGPVRRRALRPQVGHSPAPDNWGVDHPGAFPICHQNLILLLESITERCFLCHRALSFYRKTRPDFFLPKERHAILISSSCCCYCKETNFYVSLMHTMNDAADFNAFSFRCRYCHGYRHRQCYPHRQAAALNRILWGTDKDKN